MGCFCRLENCHLTEAYCKDLSSALIVNQRLTHLYLAKNALGDRGVKLLCEGLSYPECRLQALVLSPCWLCMCVCVLYVHTHITYWIQIGQFQAFNSSEYPKYDADGQLWGDLGRRL